MDIPDPDEWTSFAVDPNGGSQSSFSYYNNPKVIALNKQAQTEADNSQAAAALLRAAEAGQRRLAVRLPVLRAVRVRDEGQRQGLLRDAARQLPPRGRLQEQSDLPEVAPSARGATSRPSSAHPYERGRRDVLDRLRFVPGRLLQAVPVLFGVTWSCSSWSICCPATPPIAILGQTATPERVAALSKQLGLDDPLWHQYLLFLEPLPRQPRQSITYQVPVSDLVLQASRSRCRCWRTRSSCRW